MGCTPRAGRELDLTASEHDLLCTLARNAGGGCSYKNKARLAGTGSST